MMAVETVYAVLISLLLFSWRAVTPFVNRRDARINRFLISRRVDVLHVEMETYKTPATKMNVSLVVPVQDGQVGKPCVRIVLPVILVTVMAFVNHALPMNPIIQTERVA